MQLHRSRANKTALFLTCATLGLFLPGGALAQEDGSAPQEAGKSDLGAAPPDVGPRVEVAKLVDPPEDEAVDEGDLTAEDLASGMATPPPDTAIENQESLYGETAGEDAAAEIPVPPGFVPLQLDVRINGHKTNYVSAFFIRDDGVLASLRNELEQLRILVPGTGGPAEVVLLQDIPSVSYDYNETEQSIDIRIDPNQRGVQHITTRAQKQAFEVSSGNGVLLNYSLFSSLNSDYGLKHPSVSGVSSQLEGRVFTNWGTLEVSGIIATPDFEVAETTRLNTTVYIDDPKRMMEYQLGDVISGGTNWSRPVRLGGGQARRNFAMRPDLITMPLPELSGTAGVPSSLDVYVGGVKSYSGEVDEGPFQARDLPVFTNEGTTRVVLTDATGQSVETESDFFTSPELLRRGLFDFSLEGGFLREGFGTTSFDYAEYPVALASMRFGLTNGLTVEAHSEISEDLQNGGVGALMAVPYFGTWNLAAAGSLHDGHSGMLLYASMEKRWDNFLLTAATSRTIGDYQDLASVNSFELTGNHNGDVPKALDRLSLSYAIPEYEIGTGVSLVHALSANNERSLILSGTISKDFGEINVIGSSFADFGDDTEYGAFIGFSMPLGKTRNMTASASASRTSSGYEFGTGLAKAHSDKEYSTAWSLNYENNNHHRVTGRGELRTPVGTANTDINIRENGAGGTMAFRGAAVATKSGVLFGNHIGDSFAIVDAGAPDVKVKHENNYVGTTGRNGQVLIPSVAAYTPNKFEIDLDSLPLTAETPESERLVLPRSRSGAIVNFKVTSQTQSAIVIITDSDGKFIPLSTEIVLEGNPEPLVMGYDGEVYVTGLAEKNVLTVNLPGAPCKVEFEYTGSAQAQEFIGPLTCG
jgi:outer membrane usher protein